MLPGMVMNPMHEDVVAGGELGAAAHGDGTMPGEVRRSHCADGIVRADR